MRLFQGVRIEQDVATDFGAPIDPAYEHQLADVFDKDLLRVLLSTTLPAPDGHEVIAAPKFMRHPERRDGRDAIFAARAIPLYLVRIETRQCHLIIELSLEDLQEDHEMTRFTGFDNTLFELLSGAAATVITDSKDPQKQALFEEFRRLLAAPRARAA